MFGHKILQRITMSPPRNAQNTQQDTLCTNINTQIVAYIIVSNLGEFKLGIYCHKTSCIPNKIDNNWFR